MSQTKRPALRLEEFEPRLAPAVTRQIGTLQIRDTTGNYEWTSPATGNRSGTVVGTNLLRASLDVTYTLTGPELEQATSEKGFTLHEEEVRWVNWDPRTPKWISGRDYSVTFKNVPAGASYSKKVVIQFADGIKNDDKKDKQNTVWHQGWLKDGEGFQKTNRIDLTSVAANPGNQGGGAGNPLRPTSPEVSLAEVGHLLSPELPPSGSAGYRLLTFNSQTGYAFTAANSTGFGMFAASSSTLVEDGNGNLVLDPSTTLNPVFLDGMQAAGTYNDSNPNLVLRPNTGADPVFLSGYGYSAVPTALLSLGDGQSVTIDDEDIDDGDDMLWLVYGDGEDSHSFVLLANNSSDPLLTVWDATVTEGDSGTATATFSVNLSAAAASNVTVQYATVAGLASGSSDFTPTTGTLTFTPGETSKTVTVSVAGDTTFERDEDFFLALSAATNAIITDGVGLGAIQNDDLEPTISLDDVSQAEGNSGTTTFVFTVTLSHPSWQTVTVSFATAAGSATAGTDFEATSGTLTFEPGQTTKTITVTVYGDTVVDQGEYLEVNLSGVSNATLVDAQGLGLIEDDD